MYAFEEYGYFVAVHDKVPLKLHNDLFSTFKDLFGLPQEQKCLWLTLLWLCWKSTLPEFFSFPTEYSVIFRHLIERGGGGGSLS